MKNMSKEEFVEVTIKLPKPIAEFLQTFPSKNQNLEETITFIIIEHVRIDVENAEETLTDTYNLEPIFKKYEVEP